MSSQDMEECETEVLFEASIKASSEEPPMSEWSSLNIVTIKENEKKILHEKGLYDPGSGEICTKYIAMSASSVLAHPYFNYPVLLDPGIQEALLKPELKKVYPTDGQQKYLEICNEMGQYIVKSFYNGVLTDSINLKYYSVNPYGVRPMAMALSHNRYVTSLDFTENFLNDDACFHLGEMLTTNTTLRELNLTGCRIGASGARQLFATLPLNSSLGTLNLSKNQLGDLGIEYMAKAVERGIDVKQMILRYNNITSKSILILAEAFDINNKFTHLDLSWNNLCDDIGGIIGLLHRLAESESLLDLNLSWTSLYGDNVGAAISKVLRAPNLQFLNISNNKLFGKAINNFSVGLRRAKKLITLNLSFNPMTPEDAFNVLKKIESKDVNLKKLLMDNVFVAGAFLSLLKDIKKMKSKADVHVSYGGVIEKYIPVGPDMRDIVLNRTDFLTRKGKKQLFDIALFAMQLSKDGIQTLDDKSFANALHRGGCRINADLIDEIVSAFAARQAKTININLLVDYVRRKWPERKLPPTPPPEPEPEPVVEKKKKPKKK